MLLNANLYVCLWLVGISILSLLQCLDVNLRGTIRFAMALDHAPLERQNPSSLELTPSYRRNLWSMTLYSSNKRFDLQIIARVSFH